MAKSSGLGANFYIGGYDISNDVSALDKISSPVAQLDVTAIDKSAMERINGLRDGEIDFSTFKNFATLREHAALSTLPTADVYAMAAPGGTVVGSPAACQLAKQVNYDWTRAANGMLTGKVQCKSTGGIALEWGRLLSVGKDTLTGAASGSFIQHASQLPATVAISSMTVANPSVVTTSAPHGLVTGDSILITGTTTTPATAGNRYTITKTGASTFTIPVNVTVVTVGTGTLQQGSTDYGMAAYLQVFAFIGTDATVKLQHCADGSTSITDITGGGFTQITTGPQTQRIATTATLPIQEYVRYTVTTSGGFTSLVFAVALVRNLAAPLW